MHRFYSQYKRQGKTFWQQMQPVAAFKSENDLITRAGNGQTRGTSKLKFAYFIYCSFYTN